LQEELKRKAAPIKTPAAEAAQTLAAGQRLAGLLGREALLADPGLCGAGLLACGSIRGTSLPKTTELTAQQQPNHQPASQGFGIKPSKP